MSTGLQFLWCLRQLRKNQWCTRSEIERIQKRKLSAILKYAYENVEFYHNAFREAGIRPEDIKATSDLQKVPKTTRSNLQKQFTSFIPKGVSAEKCQKYTSSGSTGIPVTVLVGREGESYRAALFARPFFENGLKIGDKMLRVTGIPLAERWFEKLGMMRKICISPNEPIKHAIELITKYKPDVIYGHSSYLYLLAKEIEETRNETVSPRLIFTTAELMSPASKSFISAALVSEVFDLYGCVEVERISWECKEHSGYHMDADSQIVEFVDNNEEQVNRGERGKMVITCLYNYTMPLIRYELGDTGIPIDDECACGRGLPLMKSIEGRIVNYIKLSSGRVIPPTSFLDIDEIPGVGQFQVIQAKRDKIQIKLVPGRGFSENTLLHVIRKAEDIVGKEVYVETKLVEGILPEKSGKIQVVKSLTKGTDV